MTTKHHRIVIAPKEFDIQEARAKFGRMEKQRIMDKELADEKRTNDEYKPILPQRQLPLYSALHIGYKRDPEKQEKSLSKFGYVVDKRLTNYNHMTAYNPNDKTLLYVSNGTNPLRPPDLMTDLNTVAGLLKNTKRFYDDKRGYEKAKQTYKPKHIKIAGHSLGGAIARELERPDGEEKPYDLNITTFNSAAPLFDKKQNVNPAEKSYRHIHDIISSSKKNTMPLLNKNMNIPTFVFPLMDQINAHKIENLKVADNRKKIFV